jgi:hypothetical protein
MQLLIQTCLDRMTLMYADPNTRDDTPHLMYSTEDGIVGEV